MGLRSIATTGIVGAAVTAACLAVTPAATAGSPGSATATATATAGLGAGIVLDWGNRGGVKAVGLAGDGTTLVRFAVDRPGRITDQRTVTGLDGDGRLVGIDHRVQNGKLYGVGDRGGLYLLSEKGAATLVGRLSLPLQGTAFGVDFNPAANALRVISDTGQNLRQPFGDGDGPAAATVADTPLTANGAAATGLTAAAYTNNDRNGDTGTTLFDLDTVGDQVVLQSPANGGVVVPTGKLGVNADLDAGFDIVTTLRKDRAVGNKAYATIGVNGAYALYTVDLLTGEAARTGSFPHPVTDVTIPIGR